jgi:hypothetical protein
MPLHRRNEHKEKDREAVMAQNQQTTCTGEEFKAFLMDSIFWPEGRFLDHYEISMDGLDWSFDREPTDSAAVVIEPVGSVCDDDPAFSPVLLSAYFEQWRTAARNR